MNDMWDTLIAIQDDIKNIRHELSKKIISMQSEIDELKRILKEMYKHNKKLVERKK